MRPYSDYPFQAGNKVTYNPAHFPGASFGPLLKDKILTVKEVAFGQGYGSGYKVLIEEYPRWLDSGYFKLVN